MGSGAAPLGGCPAAVLGTTRRRWSNGAMVRGPVRPWLVLLAATVLACGSERSSETLRLVSFHQDGETGVFLNEALVFHFDREVDRSSITAESLVILAPGGRRVSGELEVLGRQIRFLPDLPRSADLTDGGLWPGGEHRVEVLGFPFPDGLRGRGGEPLERSHTFTFRAAGTPGAPDPAVPRESVFAPPLREDRLELKLETEVLSSALEPIQLRSEVALDPRSIQPGMYELLHASEGQEPPRTLRLDARLAENRRDGALLELRPLGPAEGTLAALERPYYLLIVSPRFEGPRTLGGLPLDQPWANSRRQWRVINIVPSLGTERVELETGSLLRSPEPVTGADGTAHWGDGQVTIRYPRAAGSGRDGHVELRELSSPDVHAVRLEVPEDARVQLPAEGPVVLRSQGLLEVHGELFRSAPPEPQPQMIFPPGTTLSGWLERALERERAWTVLIAGGDLVVQGGIEVQGPLLLVAGGRIRISGRCSSAMTWKFGAGGGPEVFLASVLDPNKNKEALDAQAAWRAGFRRLGVRLPEFAPFRMDEPVTNPLVEPLRYSVLSGAFRPASGVVAWRAGTWAGDPGAGSVRVLWRGQLPGPGGGEDEYGPVEDPLLLQGAEKQRFQIELEMPADGGVWDPPRVDYVEFRWDAPRASTRGSP